MIDQTYCKACIWSKGRERREGEERGCEWVTMGDVITILVAIVRYTMFVGVSMCDVIELGNLSKTIKINMCCRRKTSCSLFTYKPDSLSNHTGTLQNNNIMLSQTLATNPTET